MQNILTLETKKYSIKLENFEGPLDLLCHLIDSNKMDIYDVDINEITDQYICYINQMEDINLEITSEFLIMASNLLYIKSKKMLPKYNDENEEMLSEEELINRVIEYKKYKENLKKLNDMYIEGNKRFYRIQLEKLKFNKKVDMEEKELLNKLEFLYKEIIEKNKRRINTNAKNIEKIKIKEVYSVAEAVKIMFKELIGKSRFIFNKLFAKNKCSNLEIITAFAGLLEMSKRDKIETSQDKLFGDIKVIKK